MEETFLRFAAEVLGVPPESVSTATARGSISEWDSVMHLRLAMETEARYGIRLPFEKLPELNTLGDFIPYLTEARDDDAR